MSDIPTPITDAECICSVSGLLWDWVLADFARDLERQLVEVTEQRDKLADDYGKLKESIQSLLQILRIQEESDNGRMFFPNVIHSCRSCDLERINILLNRIEAIIYLKGEKHE